MVERTHELPRRHTDLVVTNRIVGSSSHGKRMVENFESSRQKSIKNGKRMNSEPEEYSKYLRFHRYQRHRERLEREIDKTIYLIMMRMKQILQILHCQGVALLGDHLIMLSLQTSHHLIILHQHCHHQLRWLHRLRLPIRTKMYQPRPQHRRKSYPQFHHQLVWNHRQGLQHWEK